MKESLVTPSSLIAGLLAGIFVYQAGITNPIWMPIISFAGPAALLMIWPRRSLCIRIAILFVVACLVGVLGSSAVAEISRGEVPFSTMTVQLLIKLLVTNAVSAALAIGGAYTGKWLRSSSRG